MAAILLAQPGPGQALALLGVILARGFSEVSMFSSHNGQSIRTDMLFPRPDAPQGVGTAHSHRRLSPKCRPHCCVPSHGTCHPPGVHRSTGAAVYVCSALGQDGSPAAAVLLIAAPVRLQQGLHGARQSREAGGGRAGGTGVLVTACDDGFPSHSCRAAGTALGTMPTWATSGSG